MLKKHRCGVLSPQTAFPWSTISSAPNLNGPGRATGTWATPFRILLLFPMSPLVLFPDALTVLLTG
ncbi:hypothetical protein LINPERHAP2_LOCUS12025 [Linum perenne]